MSHHVFIMCCCWWCTRCLPMSRLVSENLSLCCLLFVPALPFNRVQGEAQLPRQDRVQVVGLLHIRPPVIEINDQVSVFCFPGFGQRRRMSAACLYIWHRSDYPLLAGLSIESVHLLFLLISLSKITVYIHDIWKVFWSWRNILTGGNSVVA